MGCCFSYLDSRYILGDTGDAKRVALAAKATTGKGLLISGTKGAPHKKLKP